MFRLFLIALFALCLPSLASAREIFRCEKGDDVRFEQVALPGYACTRPDVSVQASATPGSSSQSSSRKGTIYKRMVGGVVEFSSRPVGGGTVVARYVLPCYACRMGKQVDFSTLPLNAVDYSETISVLARKNGIDAAWVRAIVHAESNFNPNALSPKGAQGLMQLMPSTARRFGVLSPFDPAQNLEGGVQYLAWLFKRFKGDLSLATAAYNAGEGAVDKYNGVPPYSETQTYVQRVTTLRSRYASL